MVRPSKTRTFLDVARTLSNRSTCSRRNVGCILVDSNDHIIGSGYNGVGRGLPHCTDKPCPGANKISGTGLELCEAIHAEQNALLQCGDVHSIHTAYITCSPCMHCAKLFLNTSVREIVFQEVYDQRVVEFLEQRGIRCHLLK